MERTQADTKQKTDYRKVLWIVCAALTGILTAFNLPNLSLPHKGLNDCLFLYAATALPLLCVLIAAIAKGGATKRELLFVGLALLASYAIRILLANFQSKDYREYLALWVAEYRTLPLAECFVRQVGNYPPLYNYFLIGCSRLPVSDLYLIKTLSLYGEVLTAVFAVKIVALVRRESFRFPVLTIFLLWPIFLTNGSQWGQCDTLYTLCAVAGVYFALRRRSIVCYLFIGLGLAFKMQMLLILPVGLVLLLAKNPEGKRYLAWQWIWLVPVVFFAASCVPGFFGGSYFKVLNVYLNQATVGNDKHALNGLCANILFPLYRIPKGSVAYYILLVLFTAVTAAVDLFIIVHSLRRTRGMLSARQAVQLCVLLPFVSVFFMPKMLDRFYYIAEVFMLAYCCIERDKNTFTALCLLETGQWLVYCRVFTIVKFAMGVSPVLILFALWLCLRRFFSLFPCRLPHALQKLFPPEQPSDFLADPLPEEK